MIYILPHERKWSTRERAVFSSWKWVNLCLRKVQSFYGFWRMVKSYWSHKEVQCARERNRNLQVSLMTSCIWFGSRPNPKGGEGTMTHVFNSFSWYLWALLSLIQIQASLQNNNIITPHFICKINTSGATVLQLLLPLRQSFSQKSKQRIIPFQYDDVLTWP